jgi:hypothetical protein
MESTLALELIAELELIAARAGGARRDLAVGNALTGVSALCKIHDQARDAAAHARRELELDVAV